MRKTDFFLFISSSQNILNTKNNLFIHLIIYSIFFFILFFFSHYIFMPNNFKICQITIILNIKKSGNIFSYILDFDEHFSVRMPIFSFVF
jgi:hypothetical protein